MACVKKVQLVWYTETLPSMVGLKNETFLCIFILHSGFFYRCNLEFPFVLIMQIMQFKCDILNILLFPSSKCINPYQSAYTVWLCKWLYWHMTSLYSTSLTQNTIILNITKQKVAVLLIFQFIYDLKQLFSRYSACKILNTLSPFHCSCSSDDLV